MKPESPINRDVHIPYNHVPGHLGRLINLMVKTPMGFPSGLAQESDWAEPLVDPTDLVQQLVEVLGFDVIFFVENMEKSLEITIVICIYISIYIMFIW